MVTVVGRSLVPGSAAGPIVVLAEPLSFWGGVDPDTGVIIDPHHPDRGKVVTGAVLVFPASRGSSSASSVLAEMIRKGTAPSALVLARPDAVLVLGAVVAQELYDRTMPIMTADLKELPSGEGARARVEDGTITIEPA